MVFTLNGPMLDFLVLSVIVQGDAYGYQISQRLKPLSDAKDSTLYPVLRRLQTQGLVEVYDQPFQGRNRRYYRITKAGMQQYDRLCVEWKQFCAGIEQIANGGNRA